MNLDQETLGILSALEFPEIDLARIVQPLDRRTYQRVDQAIRALGGAWSRRRRAHVFDGDARSRIDVAITTRSVTTDAELGHFPTPDPLAAWLVRHAGVRPGESALEPSAGSGAIVSALLAAGAHVTAIERDPRRREAIRSEAPLLRGTLLVPDVDDFLTYGGVSAGMGGVAINPPPFRRVVMNPPFCRSGIGDHLDHVRRALGMLAPDGILVSVLPSSLRFRRDRRYAELRELCEARGTITDLPDGSFRPSGTDVSTVAIRIEGGIR